MYMKVIGIAMIIASSTLIGFKFNENAKSRIEELKTIRNIVTMLKGEIKYNNATVSEALVRMAGRTYGNFNRFLLDMSESLNGNNQKSIDRMWSEKVKSNFSTSTYLNKNDIKEFAGLGRSIGRYDVESQMKSLDMFIEEITVKIEEEGQKAKSNGKLYKCMGIMAGIFIVLVII